MTLFFFKSLCVQLAIHANSNLKDRNYVGDIDKVGRIKVDRTETNWV
jgi:hypothetical protein